MAKQHDWIDYANLGSNLYQNVQLSGVNDKLSAMAAVAASEQAKTQREDKLREGVFQGQSSLNKLQSRQNENPAGVVAIAKLNLIYLCRYNVTTASFSAFDDKERVQKVIDGFERLVNECSALLSPDQRLEAESCANYLAEQKELSQLCLLQPVQEQLEKLQAEIQLMTEGSNLWIALQFAGFIMALGGFVAFVAILNSDKQAIITMESFAGGGFFVVGGLLLFGVAATRKPIQRSSELSKELVALLEKWPALKPELGTIQSLQQKFQAKTETEALKVQAERAAVIARVLKAEEVQPIPQNS